MINYFMGILSELLKAITSNEGSLDLGAIANIITILGAAGAILISCMKFIYGYISLLVVQKSKPINFLYNALVGKAVTSKKELIYQIKCYRTPHFKDNKTIRQLFRHIKNYSGDNRISSGMFALVGNPACGKTTTMRYLYCKLSKKRKCVYFQMQKIKSMQELSNYLRSQKSRNNFSDDTSVIAFFDGLDEAYEFFHQECPNSMEEAFKELFFKDPEPKINQIFQENNLNLDCLVVSFRPEFLERSIHSFTSIDRSNVYQKVYEIVGMSNADVIKIFKSLKVLKKLDASLDEKEQRHQNRFPPIWQEYKYTRLLRRILDDNPDCIFQYPMYIRYAYAFMNQYLNRQEVGDKLKLNVNISVSFDILVSAIIKWEFHVYKGKSSRENEEEMEHLTNQMEQCAQEIAVYLYSTKSAELSKKQFKQIVRGYFQDDIIPLVMAHCFMVSDDGDGIGNFAFCHNTFQEYFLAKYLFEKNDYALRKECFCSGERSEYLMRMYYSILCQNEELNKRISKSIVLDNMKYIKKYVEENTKKEMMTPESYALLDEKTEIILKDNPAISVVEIFKYIPYLFGFFYRNQDYLQAEVDTMVRIGKLDLEGSLWTTLDYTEEIIPFEQVEQLNISGLPIEDAESLNKFCNLKSLDMRFSPTDDAILEKVYAVLKNFQLIAIYIYSEEMGAQCDKVYTYLYNGDLHVQRVYVRTSCYSHAHLKMYAINQKFEKSGQSIRFYPSVRSYEQRAKEIYLNGLYKEKIEMLTAVFELEMGEETLPLERKNINGTLWNGLSLAESYKNAGIDNEMAQQIYQRLESYITLDDSALGFYFQKSYGEFLLHKGLEGQARGLLLNAYQCAEKYICEGQKIGLGLKIYRIWGYCREEELKEFRKELERDIKKTSCKHAEKRYAEFMKLRCARELYIWRKGKAQPESLDRLMSQYKKIVVNEDDRFHFIYYAMLCANRLENFALGEQLLEKLTQELEKMEDETIEQAEYIYWLEYYTQKLYYFFLKDEKEMVLKVIDELWHCLCK